MRVGSVDDSALHIERVRVSALRDGDPAPRSITRTFAPGAFAPGEVSYIPASHDLERALTVTVVGTFDDGAEVTSNAGVHFTPDLITLLDFNIVRACVGVRCDSGSSCGRDSAGQVRCLADRRDALPAYTNARPPSVTARDGESPTDAVAEAGFDATDGAIDDAEETGADAGIDAANEEIATPEDVPADAPADVPADAPADVPLVLRRGSLAAGLAHTCAIRADGVVRCWGRGVEGQLGDGAGESSARAVSVAGLRDPEALSAGDGHTCARTRSGDVWCWGRNDLGQLGNGGLARSLVPVQVAIAGAQEITARGDASCARTADGSVWCWGDNRDGQVGTGMSPERVPTRAYGTFRAEQIALGRYVGCGVQTDRAARCWGDGRQALLGDGSTTALRRLAFLRASDVRLVALGDHHGCALSTTGEVSCWGENSDAMLGVDAGAIETTPTPLGVTALALTLGARHTCTISRANTVICWGLMSGARLAPTEVSGLSRVVEIAAGASHTCARRDDDAVRCVGRNDQGQLGDGTLLDRATPVPTLD